MYKIVDGIFEKYEANDYLTSVHIEIPEVVKLIALRAFENILNIKSVHIPASVNAIGSNAFLGCRHLSEVIIDNPNIEIGYRAFAGCSNLRTRTGFRVIDDRIVEYVGTIDDVIIPSWARMICSGAFANNKTVTEVTFEDGTEIIGSRAFANCSNLAHIYLPNTVTSIGAQAFLGTDINEFTIPPQVTELRYGVIEDCTKLKELYIPNHVSLITRQGRLPLPDVESIIFEDGPNMQRVDSEFLPGFTGLTKLRLGNNTYLGYRREDGSWEPDYAKLKKLPPNPSYFIPNFKPTKIKSVAVRQQLCLFYLTTVDDHSDSEKAAYDACIKRNPKGILKLIESTSSEVALMNMLMRKLITASKIDDCIDAVSNALMRAALMDYKHTNFGGGNSSSKGYDLEI